MTTAALLGSVVSCRPEPTPYETALALGENARRERNFEREQQHFRQASTLAEDEEDQVEALYREAHSLERQDEPRQARSALRALAKQHPASPRAARAWLDAGRISDDLSEADEARRDYMKVLSLHPGSGGAKSAAKRLAELNALEGRPASETYRELLEETENADLEQELRMLLADSLRKSHPRASIQHYETLARRYPLPNGTLTDDALLASAALRRQLGDATGAREVLTLLLSYDTHAVLIGSYTRASFLKAHFLKAEIEADELASTTDARKTLAHFISTHPRSRYLDDAWWNAARLIAGAGSDPCPTLERLSETRPQSRFDRCRRDLCPWRGAASAASLGDRCRSWWNEGSPGPLTPE